MVLFKDLNKLCNDLLNRDFVHKRPLEVELKHQARNPVFTQSAAINSTNNNTEFFSTIRNAGVWGHVEVKMGTGSSTADMICKPNRLPGVIFGSRFEAKNSKDSQVSADISIEAEAQTGIIRPGLLPHLRVGVNPLLQTWLASFTTALPACCGTTAVIASEIGGSRDVKSIKYQLGASFTQKTKDVDWTVALIASPHESKALGKVTGSLHARTSRSGSPELGAEVVHILSPPKTDVSFVGQWSLDDGGNENNGKNNNNNTTLKMKVTQDMKIVSSLTHKFNKSLTGTLGAQIDPMNSGDLKYGLKLNVVA